MYDGLLLVSITTLVLATHGATHAHRWCPACTSTSSCSRSRLIRLIIVDIHHFVQLLLQAETLAAEIADCLVLKRPLRIYLVCVEVFVLWLDIFPEIGGWGRTLLYLDLLSLRQILILILNLALTRGP